MAQGGAGAFSAPGDNWDARFAGDNFSLAAVAKQEDGPENTFFDDANFEFDGGELPRGFRR
jgi:hypothetical protein